MKTITTYCSMLVCVLAVALGGWPGSSGAAPQSVTIQGTLQDGGGAALSGSRAYQVKFFDAAAAGNQLGGTLNGLTTVEDSGRFSFAVVLPAEAVGENAVYYELGIDSAVSPDGSVDAADIFPDRVQVTSVPFARNAPPRTFEAIVSAAGDGDFSTLQAALGAGAKTIFVRNGTYNLTSSVIFRDPGITIIGESMHGVVFDAQLANRFIQVGGGIKTSTGSVSVNQNSTAVLGTGTAFLTNHEPGDLIELPRNSGNLFEIATIVGEDGLTLKYPYRGESLSSRQYTVYAPSSNIHIENITIANYRGDFQAAFYLVGLMDSTVSNCRAVNCAPNGFRVLVSRNSTFVNNVAEHGEVGFFFESSRNHRVIGNRAFNNSNNGMSFTGVEYFTIQGNTVYNNQMAGMAVVSSSYTNTITGNVARNNIFDGILLDDAAHRNIVMGNECGGNGRDGLRLENNCDYNTLTSNVAYDNGEWGIRINASTCASNIISSSIITSNVTGPIINNGTGTVLTGNVP